MSHVFAGSGVSGSRSVPKAPPACPDDWRYSGNDIGNSTAIDTGGKLDLQNLEVDTAGHRSTAIDTGGKLDLQNLEVDTAGHRMSGCTAETLDIPQSAGKLITNMPESRKGVILFQDVGSQLRGCETRRVHMTL